MKWAIVLAGVSDFFRPAEKLSLTQNLALTATGTIWTRWCFIIKPKNYLYETTPSTTLFAPCLVFRVEERAPQADVLIYRLAAVNFCLAIVGTIQVSRILRLRASQTGGNVEEAVEVSKEEEKRAAVGVKEDVKRVVK